MCVHHRDINTSTLPKLILFFGFYGFFFPRLYVAEVSDSCAALEAALDQWEVRRLLGGKYDALSATVNIYAGAGGTDAQDWTEMLERMYLSWAVKRGFSVKTTSRLEGEEAGLKSVTLEVEGRFAYGYLGAEKGTHRLVRQSPFKKDATRQTSFAAVDVMPVLDDDLADAITINPADLEVGLIDKSLSLSTHHSRRYDRTV